jgi:hypothetical protein
MRQHSQEMGKQVAFASHLRMFSIKQSDSRFNTPLQAMGNLAHVMELHLRYTL